jgi:hypothetical protein
MAMTQRQFEVVEEIPDNPPSPRGEQTAAYGLMLALKALSQRALTAIANLFMLATVGSAFLLWMWTPAPTIRQLVGLGMYGLFILAANWIVRRT